MKMKKHINKVLAVATVAAAFTWTHAASALNIGFVRRLQWCGQLHIRRSLDQPADSAGPHVTPFAQTTAKTDPRLAAMACSLYLPRCKVALSLPASELTSLNPSSLTSMASTTRSLGAAAVRWRTLAIISSSWMTPVPWLQG